VGECSPGSAAAGTAHHLVGDQDHSMPITADVAQLGACPSLGAGTTPPAAPTTGSDERLPRCAHQSVENLFLQLPCAVLGNLVRSCRRAAGRCWRGDRCEPE
jgi:hypothetical protein